ncbi:hypothetical protein [Bradyrhizobium sp. WSM2254]|uniref:hypothetical protein n=1 Tax=Bradyrhizobium sp. WSM2254 TaxID=1188263 RepID=UPI0004034E60|nr:hypothetical protein [Bradyrhizobium sp. WSM2254]
MAYSETSNCKGARTPERVLPTADYKLIVNAALNADRGPVSVFSSRLHGEF